MADCECVADYVALFTGFILVPRYCKDHLISGGPLRE